jgi:peptide chain release factor 1
MNDVAAQYQADQLQARYDHLVAQLATPSLEPAKRAGLQKEVAFLTQALEKIKRLASLYAQQQELTTQRAESADADYQQLIDEELANLAQLVAQETKELDALMFPADERNDRSVFLEIRAGTGGQEAALFAGDLLRMYTMYAGRKGWRTSLVSESSTDLGGYREVVLEIIGKGVFGHLKHEAGVHRVQRVPKTETSGRIHTSTATVVVLPEAEDVEISINPQDLRIDSYRSSGAGGQHVNVTDSAVRITHIPTGIVVACQDERSQHKNKAKAMKVLQSRLLAASQQKQEAEMSAKRREMIAGGERAEKVRTYNFPQNRVTDHQVELTLKNLDMVMEGALDPIIEALMKKEEEERRKQPRAFAT